MLVSSRATNILLVIMIAIGIGIVAMLASGARGGPLDPPGPPASTGSVRLPGTPISQPAGPGGFPIVISQSGHYYLTENLQAPADTNGIAIDADNVTIDLMGFTMRGAVASPVSGPGSAIILDVIGGATVRKNIVIRNGIIDGWTQCGVAGALFEASVLEDLNITGGPCGVEMGAASLARRLNITRVLGTTDAYGIQVFNPGTSTQSAVIEETTISLIGGSGIITGNSTIVRDSTVEFANQFGGGLGGVVITGANVILEGNILRKSVGNDLSAASAPNSLTVVRNVICLHDDVLGVVPFENDYHVQLNGAHIEDDMFPDLNTTAVC